MKRWLVLKLWKLSRALRSLSWKLSHWCEDQLEAWLYNRKDKSEG